MTYHNDARLGHYHVFLNVYLRLLGLLNAFAHTRRRRAHDGKVRHANVSCLRLRTRFLTRRVTGVYRYSGTQRTVELISNCGFSFSGVRVLVLIGRLRVCATGTASSSSRSSGGAVPTRDYRAMLNSVVSRGLSNRGNGSRYCR